MGDELLTLLGTVFTILLVLVLAYGCTRLLAGRLPGTVTGSGQRIRILEKVPMGKDSHLLLVKLGDTYQFFGRESGCCDLSASGAAGRGGALGPDW